MPLGLLSGKWQKTRKMRNSSKVIDKIIIGMVSYNEIYKRRNTVVKWLMFVIPVTSAVITLTIRDKILKTANKDNKI